MLNRNYAQTIASIANSGANLITAPKNEDYIAIMRQAGEDYQKGKQLQADNAFTEEMVKLHPEEEARIRQMGGRAYADVMQGRQWQKEDADTQFARQKELANIQFNNNMALKRLEAALKPATAAQQNMQYLQQMGYSPEEAAQLYYSGQNPSLNVMMLGTKGQEAYGKEAGKNIAEREKAAQEAQDEYNTVVSNIDRINELLPNASVQTFIDRKTPTMFFSPEAQQARGELRNLLGGMRLDQMKYMKGAISDKEQEFLSDVVSGDFSKYTPDEIKGTMNSIKRKAGQIKNQFANMSAIPQKTDWANASNEDLLKGL